MTQTYLCESLNHEYTNIICNSFDLKISNECVFNEDLSILNTLGVRETCFLQVRGMIVAVTMTITVAMTVAVAVVMMIMMTMMITVDVDLDVKCRCRYRCEYGGGSFERR